MKRFSVVLLLMAVVLISTHLSGQTTHRLVIGMIQEPDVLNPMISQMRVSGFVGNFLFGYFVRYDDKMRLIPDLITEVPTRKNGGVSDDGLTYKYHLRKNVLWHDGKPLTSADVRFTYRLIMNPQVNIPSRQGWDKVKEILTPDKQTVIFKLKEPYVNFVADTFFEEPVLPKHLLQGKTKNFSALRFQQRPIGSGPYILKEWKRGSHIELKANKKYYRKEPALKTIIIKFVPNQQVLMVQLETGEIDAAEGIQTSEVKRASNIQGLKIYKAPVMTYEHLTFNLESEMVRYPVVRKAIALSVNRKVLSEKVYNSIWEPCYSPFFKNSPYYDPKIEKTLAFNPAGAKKLLKEHGWTDKDGDGIVEKNREELNLQITTTAGRTLREMTEEILQQQLKKVGIGLTIKNEIASILFNLRGDGGILEQGRYQLALFSWHSSPDPSILENLFSKDFIPKHGQNFARIKNNQLTRLLKKGSMTLDPLERIKTYHQVSDILADELPILPLLRTVKVLAYPAPLKNVKPNATQLGTSWNCYEWAYAKKGKSQNRARASKMGRPLLQPGRRRDLRDDEAKPAGCGRGGAAGMPAPLLSSE